MTSEEYKQKGLTDESNTLDINIGVKKYIDSLSDKDIE